MMGGGPLVEAARPGEPEPGRCVRTGRVCCDSEQERTGNKRADEDAPAPAEPAPHAASEKNVLAQRLASRFRPRARSVYWVASAVPVNPNPHFDVQRCGLSV